MTPYDDCAYCGGEVEEKLIRLDYRYHGQLFIIEGARVGVCNQCGERFLTAAEAKRLEALAKSEAAPLTTVAVPVLRAS